MAQNALAQKEQSTNGSAAESIHAGPSFTPRVDILETENELTLFADVPGCNPQDVDVRYENGQLEIHCKCPARQESENPSLNEYGVGDYYRTFTINESIDSDKINATLKQGVLTVTLPKSGASAPRRIAVRAE